MAFYLPILSAIVIGVSLLQGAISVAVAVGVVALILYVALRHGHIVSRLFPADQYEPLLLGVLGLTMLVAGLAAQVGVSAAVGAFLVGIALSGRVAANASQVLTPLRDLFAATFFVFFGLTSDSSGLIPMLLPALALAIVTIATKLITGAYAARLAGVGTLGQWRAGLSLAPRGEFSIVIAGIAVTAGAGRRSRVADRLLRVGPRRHRPGGHALRRRHRRRSRPFTRGGTSHAMTLVVV